MQLWFMLIVNVMVGVIVAIHVAYPLSFCACEACAPAYRLVAARACALKGDATCTKVTVTTVKTLYARYLCSCARPSARARR